MERLRRFWLTGTCNPKKEEKKASEEGGGDSENGVSKQNEESEVKYLEEEKKSLLATLEELQDKMKKAEQNREHWKLGNDTNKN